MLFYSIIYSIRKGKIVNFSYIISLFYDEISVVQDICYESMSFDIQLENAFCVDEFYVIYENKRSMSDDDTQFTNDHNLSIEIDSFKYNTKEEVVYTEYKYGENDIITQISRKNISVRERYPYYNRYQKKKEDIFYYHEKEKYSMTMYENI